MSETFVEPRRPGSGRASLRVAVVTVLLLLLVAFMSIVWTPFPADSLDVGATLQGPGTSHWLGTDQLGRDVLSITMRGALTSFVVAAVAVLIGALLGIPLGVASAAWRGTAGRALLGAGDLLVLVPALLVAVVLASLFGASSVIAMLALGLANVPAFARAARDALVGLDGADFRLAARLAGMDAVESFRRHVLPGVLTAAGAQAATQMAVGILGEATLAFVGLGAQSPANSLGLMLRDAQSYVALNPMPAIVAGAIIVVLAVALTLVGDSLRNSVGQRFGSGVGDGAA